VATPVWKNLRTRISDHLVRRWPVNGRQSEASAAIVSFCFDDFYRSAAQDGAETLDRHAMKATYYAAGGLMGSTCEGLDLFARADLEELIRHGHEIGCHTFNHVRLPDCDGETIEEEIARNRSFILDFADRLASFAYPFGAVSVRSKYLVGRHFPVCRGIDAGINSGLIDFGQLKAVEITPALSLPRVRALLDSAKAMRGWLIFFTHDVSRSPSEHGCRTSDLRAIIDKVGERGMEVLPVGAAAAKVNPFLKRERLSSDTGVSAV